MIHRWAVVASVAAAVLIPVAAAAQGLPRPTLPSVPHTDLEPPAHGRGPYLPVPPGAALDAEVKPSEVGFDDRVFRSQLSYGEVVAFYDRTFREQHTKVVSRVVAPDGVTYQVRLPSGSVGRVILRKTQPAVTIETHEPG